MLYGLYLSAAGVMTNSYRQDVIANNLANSESIGFKRDLASFRERLTQAKELGLSSSTSDATMEKLSGGLWALPTALGGFAPASYPLLSSKQVLCAASKSGRSVPDETWVSRLRSACENVPPITVCRGFGGGST